MLRISSVGLYVFSILIDMTICLISRQQMVESWQGCDKYSYEFKYIDRWLGDHTTSPMTKGYLDMDDMNHDYMMERVIQSSNEFNIL